MALFALMVSFIACLVCGTVLVLHGHSLWGIWPVSLSAMLFLCMAGMIQSKSRTPRQDDAVSKAGGNGRAVSR